MVQVKILNARIIQWFAKSLVSQSRFQTGEMWRPQFKLYYAMFTSYFIAPGLFKVNTANYANKLGLWPPVTETICTNISGNGTTQLTFSWSNITITTGRYTGKRSSSTVDTVCRIVSNLHKWHWLQLKIIPTWEMYWLKKAPLVSGIDFFITGTIVLNWLAKNTLQPLCINIHIKVCV